MGYDTDEIIKITETLYTYGEWDATLVPKIEVARTLLPGEKVINFGIGGGARDCLIMALANPDIWIFTFDKGRHEYHVDEDLLIHVFEICKQYGVQNIIPWISEATEALPTWKSPIGILEIDTDGVGTGEQLERWAPFVRAGGTIFIQNYGFDKYDKVQEEADAFIAKDPRYVLGEQYPHTLGGGPQLRAINVI